MDARLTTLDAGWRLLPRGDRAVRFPESLRLRVPRGLPAAVAAAARRHHTSAPEWVRQTLLRSLAADGVRLRDGEVEMTEART